MPIRRSTLRFLGSGIAREAGQDAENGRQRRRVAAITNTELSNREQEMSKFKVVTPKGASFTVAGGGYAYEKEALDPIGAEIVEAPANEAEFIAAARTADAIYGKGMPISKTIIDALENCKVITLGSVGVDSADAKPPTPPGIPATTTPATL